MKRALVWFIAAVVLGVGAVERASHAQGKAQTLVVCAPDSAEASKQYEAALAASPESLEAAIALGQCHDTAWRFADAETVIRRLIARVQPLADLARRTGLAPGDLPTVGAGLNVPRVTEPAYLDYPTDAADRGVMGTVPLDIRIDRQGRVRQARVIESHPWLDVAARRAVERLRFEPPIVEGKPADVRHIYFVGFGRPQELMPADWLDRARIYLSLNLPAHALEALHAALARTERDRARFGDAGSVASGAVRLTQDQAGPTRIRFAQPVYPDVAVRRGLQGVVILEGLLDKFGEVGRLRVLRSAPLFDGAAIDAVFAWGYVPARVDGEATTAILTVTVFFQLRE